MYFDIIRLIFIPPELTFLCHTNPYFREHTIESNLFPHFAQLVYISLWKERDRKLC